MSQVNKISYPGGLAARLLWRLVKGIPIYPAINENYGNSEETTGEHGSSRSISVPSIAGETVRYVFRELLSFPDIWIYLHGSQADKTANSFSDYDDLVVIDLFGKEQRYIRRLIKALNWVDMRFCRLDPLQHHGHWIISKESLQNYDESFMPLSVLQTGMVIQGPTEIRYHVNRTLSRKGLEKTIQVTAQNIIKLYKHYASRRINLYQWKGLISSFALMPALIFQYQGERISKPKAIARAQDFFTTEAYACMRWATVCRENWGQVTNARRYNIFGKFVYLFTNPHLYRQFAKRLTPMTSSQMLSSAIPLTLKNVDAFIAESTKLCI